MRSSSTRPDRRDRPIGAGGGAGQRPGPDLGSAADQRPGGDLFSGAAQRPGGDLGSAAVPPPASDDHARGEGRLVIEYASFECPYCARTDALLAELSLRRVFRHFPVASKHPRARALAHAAEAAALQGRFWEFHDSLMADQARSDDPHLWQRCATLGLDVARFESDRRSEAVAARVERDFRSAIRAGVTATPTLFVDGAAHPGTPDAGLLAALAR